MLKDGFPKPGFVSPCKSYYITAQMGECYKSITEKIGLEKWQELTTLPFNKRFYNTATARTTFKGNTIVKIPTHLVSDASNCITQHETLLPTHTCSTKVKGESKVN